MISAMNEFPEPRGTPAIHLFLVQHGEAAAKELDPDRPLTAHGREEVAQVAARLATVRIRPGSIFHSGKLRARQSAELFARVMGGGHVEAAAGLDPDDPVEGFAGRLGRLDSDTMYVGHLPFMARLVSFLLSGVADAERVRFRTGSVVCLSRGATGAWSLEWMLRPELVSATES